ncbi:MAG: imidazole glycerol phosphate synthase subunit HisH [Bacteroidetes bacterium]|nr:imidazole glycerol phosphate synthase subunit HisH [Bacteroidota bacterium]
MKTIAVLDYGIGNVRSQLNALEAVGARGILTNNHDEILGADAVILPGVGAFRHGMENLEKHNLISVIHEYIRTGKPFLGICLGMQLLFEESDEFGHSKGLGLVAGKIQKLPLPADGGLRLPHIGWKEIDEFENGGWADSILETTKPHSAFYFVHSYAAVPASSDTWLAKATFGEHTFCCAVKQGNIFGTQFHPEKSGESGLQIIKKFTEI